MKKLSSVLLFWLAVSFSYGQILNPVLGDALLLSKGDFEITTGYSALGIAYDGESEGFFNSLDFQFGYGISEKVSLIARYQKAWYAKEMFQEGAGSFLFIGPEIQLKEDRIAVFLPLGTRFSQEDNDSYFEITPTIKFSVPISKKVYFNPALELGFTFCEYCSDKPYLGIDLGLGVRPTEKVSFFAEYDLVYSFEEFGDGHFYMINGGVAFQISGKD